MTMFYALLVLCLSGSALTKVPTLGSCPQIPGQFNFDVNKFQGHWYISARYFTVLDSGSDCDEVEFTILNNGSVRGVRSFLSPYDRIPKTVQVDFQPDRKNPAKMTSLLPGTPWGEISDCYMLATDYDNYSVMYCCTQYKFTHLRWSWILTRDRLRNQSVIENAFTAFENNNVKWKPFWKIDHENCPKK